MPERLIVCASNAHLCEDVALLFHVLVSHTSTGGPTNMHVIYHIFSLAARSVVGEQANNASVFVLSAHSTLIDSHMRLMCFCLCAKHWIHSVLLVQLAVQHHSAVRSLDFCAFCCRCVGHCRLHGLSVSEHSAEYRLPTFCSSHSWLL